MGSHISEAVVLTVKDVVCILFMEQNISYGVMHTT